jgi:hypothetical protein
VAHADWWTRKMESHQEQIDDDKGSEAMNGRKKFSRYYILSLFQLPANSHSLSHRRLPFHFHLFPFSVTMMLVQKAQPALLSSPAQFSHRRHPSAPVVVQPTHVPGLLILSKPPRPSPSRQHQQQHRNQGRIQPRNGPKSSISTPVRAQTLIPAAEITDNIKTATTAPATPSPQSRGRSHAKISKEKNKRLVGHFFLLTFDSA